MDTWCGRTRDSGGDYEIKPKAIIDYYKAHPEEAEGYDGPDCTLPAEVIAELKVFFEKVG